MKGIALILVIFLLFTTMLPTSLTEAQPAFEPIGRTYIYDVQGDGNIKCTWETSILPLQSSILYPFTFRGGKISDAKAIDSLGQELDIDVDEKNSQTTVNLYLIGCKPNEPYYFNLTFIWSGLLTRRNDRHTLFTSVNIGEPQSTKIIVIIPKDAKLSTSTIWRGNITEVFEKQLISERDALVWQITNTGNEIEIFFRVNFKFYSTLLWIQDNLHVILGGTVIAVLGALLLGYRKPARRFISKASKWISQRL